MLFRRLRFIVAGVMVTVSIASPVAGDAGESYVTEWNRHAAAAIFNNGPNPPAPMLPGNPLGAMQPPYLGAIHMAMVQVAVYDAVNDIVGGYQPYRDPAGSPPADASQDAAAVSAAYEVLVAETLRLPSYTLEWIEIEHTATMTEIAAEAAANGEDFDAGVAAGEAAAAAMLGARVNDRRYPTTAFFHPEGELAGQWRPTTTGVRDQFAWVGNVQPFMLSSESQMRSEGPQALTSDEYTTEYNEVKGIGAIGSSRTQAQNDLAFFFQPQPIEMFNRNFRRIADELQMTVADEARLLAMLNIAGADTLISCWNDKTFHRFWRPVTAIRNGDNDGNPDTAGDGGWTPLITNPPYPDHPSGYNCGASAMMYAAAVFFGTKQFEFDVHRTVGGPVRHYSRFTDVVKDTIDARVYQGIHFRSADVQAANMGKHVAHWLERYYFQPVE